MTATTATSPGTASNDDSIGTVAWVDPNNVKIEDGSKSRCPNAITYYLTATNYGFSVPTGATINGIKIEVKKTSFNGVAVDNAIRIIKGGSIGSTDKSSIDTWETSLTYKTYGGATDLWGETWTAEDINLSTFGFAISANALLSQASIDHIRITVYYTEALGGSLTGVSTMTGVQLITF